MRTFASSVIQTTASVEPGSAIAEPGVAWTELVRVHFADGALKVEVGPSLLVLVIAILVPAALSYWIRKRSRVDGKSWEVVSAEIDLAGLGKVTLQPNNLNTSIAYQAWIELATRKVALPFDENHDSIIEVYNSWYQVFGRLRDLTKTIPAQQLRKDEATRKLVETLVKLLNCGLRPHLTRFQLEYRNWYETASKATPGTPLLEIQRSYPKYRELLDDMHRVNDGIVKYADWLKRIAGMKQA